MEEHDLENRLSEIGPFSFERWRMRGNLMDVHRVMGDIDRVDCQRLFPKAEMANRRAHSFKVLERRSRVYARIFLNAECGECVELAASNGGGVVCNRDF